MPVPKSKIRAQLANVVTLTQAEIVKLVSVLNNAGRQRRVTAAQCQGIAALAGAKRRIAGEGRVLSISAGVRGQAPAAFIKAIPGQRRRQRCHVQRGRTVHCAGGGGDRRDALQAAGGIQTSRSVDGTEITVGRGPNEAWLAR